MRRRVAWLVGFPILLFMCFMLAPITTAFSSTVQTATSATAPVVIFGIAVDTAFVLSLVTGLVIPLVSSLLSKTHWSGGVTGVITLALSAVSGFCTEWAKAPDLDHYDWKHAVVISAGALLMAYLGRNVAWRGSQVDSKLLSIGSSGLPPHP